MTQAGGSSSPASIITRRPSSNNLLIICCSILFLIGNVFLLLTSKYHFTNVVVYPIIHHDDGIKINNRALRRKKTKSDNYETQSSSSPCPGVVILGMHRSGTSMTAGIFAEGMNYYVGNKLLGSSISNAKGHFERRDVLKQNKILLAAQNKAWTDTHVQHYDHQGPWPNSDARSHESALAFLNDPTKSPWVLKEPRLCITLRTWLARMTRHPAVLFLYRDPLEVARSITVRLYKIYTIEHALRLWIVYNMLAIRNSADLCRVVTSTEAIYADPLGEMRRIVGELTMRCGVPPPPRELTQEIIDGFVDPGLHHQKKQGVEEKVEERAVLARWGDCVAYDYERNSVKELVEASNRPPDFDKSLYEKDLNEATDRMNQDPFWYVREKEIYLKAMKVYCDLKSGEAYKPDYPWPEV